MLNIWDSSPGAGNLYSQTLLTRTPCISGVLCSGLATRLFILKSSEHWAELEVGSQHLWASVYVKYPICDSFCSGQVPGTSWEVVTVRFTASSVGCDQASPTGCPWWEAHRVLLVHRQHYSQERWHSKCSASQSTWAVKRLKKAQFVLSAHTGGSWTQKPAGTVAV